MIIENFCRISNNKVSFSRQQASDFAKQIADDFNPLHDVEAKRFCVPGDLLFAVASAKAGLHKKMSFYHMPWKVSPVNIAALLLRYYK